MQKISYAQNFEDVILARVFDDLPVGHYIDVGANDPVHDSVTKYFYDLGWSGINIEPLEAEFELLMSERPRDINLNICAGSIESVIEFTSVENRSGWSTSNPNQMVKIKKDPELSHKTIYREQKSLNQIIKESNFQTFHFLKIDVEGSEGEVLKGIDLSIHRPWVILLESTEPGSQVEAHFFWEDSLLSNHYSFVYFDGVNRFYLANEHQDLLNKFKSPPNVFDNFIPWVAVDYYQQFMNEKETVFNLQKKINEIYSSNSWKYSLPLRQISKVIKRFKSD